MVCVAMSCRLCKDCLTKMCMSIMHATACHTAYCVVILSFIMLLYRPECVCLENPVSVGIVYCVLWFHVSAYVINFSSANACKLLCCKQEILF